MSFDIKIVQLKKQNLSGLQASKLVLEFSGKDVNKALVNSLRRISMDYIPTYAFTQETITIDKNTSGVFDNDRIRLRISQMIVPNIYHPITFLSNKYRHTKYSDTDRSRHPDDIHNIEMHINVKNTSPEILNVTTNHAKFYNNGKELKNAYDKNYPHLIIRLRQNEEFSCKAVAVLDIVKRDNDSDNRWAATANCWFEKINNNKYKFFIKSIGQLDEYVILHKGCKIMKEKLIEIKHIIGNRYKNSNTSKEINIVLENENHTLGSILNYLLQDHKDISFSGLAKLSHLEDEITIKINTNNSLKPFFETINRIIKLYTHIEQQIVKLGDIS